MEKANTVSRRIGLDARKKFVEPIAAFFSQVGELHQVIHMWHYEVGFFELHGPHIS
jgi:hypothetical protein